MALDGIGPVVTDITTAGLAPTLVAIATFAVGFLAGVFDSVLGSDDEDTAGDEPSSTDGGTMFDESGDAEADFEPGDDDPFGGDAFAVDEPDPETSDLEPRIEQLEEEVSSLSSTVSTVRTENEQISESIGEVEENVRKLLDIYKMVTKGVNPFVDQQSGGVAASVDEETLGLFEDDDEPEEATDLDEEVMEAEAEEFFDDGFEAEPATATDDAGTDAGDDTDARSFDDLKSEYDTDEPDSQPASTQEPPSGEQQKPADAAPAAGQPEPAGQPTPNESAASADTAGEFTPPADTEPTPPPSAGETGRPYLRVLPPGFATDQLVLEWLGFLIDASDPETTYTAITHYERLGWLGEEAAAHLQQFVAGHPAASPPLRGTGHPTGLTVDHHLQSLKYIARLSGSGGDLWLWGNELSQLGADRR